MIFAGISIESIYTNKHNNGYKCGGLLFSSKFLNSYSNVRQKVTGREGIKGGVRTIARLQQLVTFKVRTRLRGTLTSFTCNPAVGIFKLFSSLTVIQTHLLPFSHSPFLPPARQLFLHSLLPDASCPKGTAMSCVLIDSASLASVTALPICGQDKNPIRKLAFISQTSYIKRKKRKKEKKKKKGIPAKLIQPAKSVSHVTFVWYWYLQSNDRQRQTLEPCDSLCMHPPFQQIMQP